MSLAVGLGVLSLLTVTISSSGLSEVIALLLSWGCGLQRLVGLIVGFHVLVWGVIRVCAEVFASAGILPGRATYLLVGVGSLHVECGLVEMEDFQLLEERWLYSWW
jgi:hypothetical protein